MYLKNQQKYNTFIFEVDEENSLKNIMINQMGFSSRFISMIKKDAVITVDEIDVPKDSFLKKNQIIKVVLPDEKSEYKVQKSDLKVLFEDEDVFIVEKNPFIAVHPTKSHLENTLLNYVLYEFEKRGIKSKPRFVSRLDFNTSGIVTVAKNPFAHYILSMGSYSECIKKYYTAIVHGEIKEEKGKIDFPIEKSDDGIRRIVSDDGKNAVTYFRKIRGNKDFSEVELLLETGRTHQIRVHMKHIGHIVVGDELYASDYKGINRQALHASKLILKSPRNNKEIIVESELPDDIKKIIMAGKVE